MVGPALPRASPRVTWAPPELTAGKASRCVAKHPALPKFAGGPAQARRDAGLPRWHARDGAPVGPCRARRVPLLNSEPRGTPFAPPRPGPSRGLGALRRRAAGLCNILCLVLGVCWTPAGPSPPHRPTPLERRSAPARFPTRPPLCAPPPLAGPALGLRHASDGHPEGPAPAGRPLSVPFTPTSSPMLVAGACRRAPPPSSTPTAVVVSWVPGPARSRGLAAGAT